MITDVNKIEIILKNSLALLETRSIYLINDTESIFKEYYIKTVSRISILSDHICDIIQLNARIINKEYVSRIVDNVNKFKAATLDAEQIEFLRNILQKIDESMVAEKHNKEFDHDINSTRDQLFKAIKTDELLLSELMTNNKSLSLIYADKLEVLLLDLNEKSQQLIELVELTENMILAAKLSLVIYDKYKHSQSLVNYFLEQDINTVKGELSVELNNMEVSIL